MSKLERERPGRSTLNTWAPQEEAEEGGRWWKTIAADAPEDS